jgi:hypothetical protein
MKFLCNFLQPAAISSLLRPLILLRNVFPDTVTYILLLM